MFRKIRYILISLGTIPVVWFGLLLASHHINGLISFLSSFPDMISSPFDIYINENSYIYVIISLGIYLVIVILVINLNEKGHKTEFGSATLGDPVKIGKKYSTGKNRKLLTENVSLSFDSKKHQLNLNTIIVGGSGSGKTRSYALPNILACDDVSLVILDPKGEIYRICRKSLEKKGYDIRVINLVETEKSYCYNPISYLKSDNDVQVLVTNLFKSTQPKNSTTTDPFWDTAASMLLMALIFYIKYEEPPYRQNFATVMEMLRNEFSEEDDKSELEYIFSNLEKKSPEHVALKYYKEYRSGAAKTIKSIQITLASRLEKFNLSSLSALTYTDELDLEKMGEKKMALFVIIPDNDTSFNFLPAMLYSQLFQILFRTADGIYGGRLPVPVHFMMDEFANVALPPSFPQILSVMRSRGIFVSIILQNMAQLKTHFDKEWESVTGNCDTFLYLGGNEQSTHEYISKMMGKKTLEYHTFNQAKGRSGSHSENQHLSARDLMSGDEIRRLPSDKAILFLRGEMPIVDKKIELKRYIKEDDIKEKIVKIKDDKIDDQREDTVLLTYDEYMKHIKENKKERRLIF